MGNKRDRNPTELAGRLLSLNPQIADDPARVSAMAVDRDAFERWFTWRWPMRALRGRGDPFYETARNAFLLGQKAAKCGGNFQLIFLAFEAGISATEDRDAFVARLDGLTMTQPTVPPAERKSETAAPRRLDGYFNASRDSRTQRKQGPGFKAK